MAVAAVARAGLRGDALCLHCRQPLAHAAKSAFCCSGCERVHELLGRAGLERFYALRGDSRLAPVSEQTSAAGLGWLEQIELDSAAQGTGARRIALDIQGVQCGACVWLLEALFRRLPEAYRIDVNPALGRLLCVVGAGFPLRELVAQVQGFGYRLGPARKRAASNALMLRTGVCVALALNNMLLSAALYLGLEAGPLHELVQNASFGLATASALVGGSYFVSRAWASLSRRVLHLDLPIAIGLSLAYAGSAWSLYFGAGQAAYLDSVSVFIALMLVGRLLQERLVERNRRQLLESDGASGLLARRLTDGRTELVSCPALAAGDVLVVCPGEIVPVDATLRDAHAECSLDWINGESEPRAVTAGQRILAGSINVGPSAITVQAESAFDRSNLDVLLRDGDAQRPRLRGDFWDLVARWYVLSVLGATALTALTHLLLGARPGEVLDVATAVLVVTCPCAFGIAVPLAYELGVSGLRRVGLFVRDGAYFDRAAGVRRIVFDKTGTLTTGVLELDDPASLEALTPLDRRALYDLSARSNHPKSAAIARALAERDEGLRLSDVEVREAPGQGLELKEPFGVYRLGAPGWASPAGDALPGPVFSRDATVLARLSTREVYRPDAEREAQALAADGYELWIASGDQQAHVSALSDRLAIPRSRALGELDPRGKAALIELIGEDDTLMIGDGINDGLALSLARASGTPAVDRPFVPARSDFYYLTPGLWPVRRSLLAAKAVRRVVVGALVFAAAYNVLAVGLCAAGWMKPWLAALLMPASSLLVISYTAAALSPRRQLWKP